VGIKTTQVRSLSGEMLIFSNSDLTKSRIRNFKRMVERRIVWNFSIPYATPRDKAAAVPHMVRDAFKGLDQVRFDRAHLKGFGAAALEYEAVYYVLSDDYALYMNLNQKACLSLLERFEAEGIAFAVPAMVVAGVGHG
jgi:small-conductance mechanosensitive channel